MSFDDTRLEVGAGIREWRTRLQLTQDELAAMAKVHVNALGRVERGEANPTLKTLWKIASKLKLSVVQLLLGPPRE